MRVVVLIMFMLLSLTGCSDPPRTIESAKPIATTTNTATPTTELPKLDPPAQSDTAARELIAQLLDAHTGKAPAKLQKLQAVTVTREGTAITFTPMPTSQKWQLSLAWPNRLRYRVEIPGFPIVTLGYNGTDAWKHLGNVLPPVREPMSATDAEDFRLDATGDWLLLLHPLQQPEAKFAKQPESTVNGKPVNLVRVWVPGLSDAQLAFDQSTNLLIQVLFDGREQNKKTLKEFLILDHREFLGVKLPEKLVYKSNGNQLGEFTVRTVEALEPLNAKLFTEP